jgi:hypothetical protein
MRLRRRAAATLSSGAEAEAQRSDTRGYPLAAEYTLARLRVPWRCIEPMAVGTRHFANR